MIKKYGVMAIGPYHIKNNIVCQDYYEIIPINDDICIAAVADGLGSAEHSDIAAKLAATVSCDYCSKRVSPKSTKDEIINTITGAFYTAQNAIEKEVQAAGHDLAQYDTTLTLAVLIHDNLYYGHSGDGGMIALTTKGRFEAVTQQQRDDEGRVFPLFFEEKWVFGQYEHTVEPILSRVIS